MIQNVVSGSLGQVKSIRGPGCRCWCKLTLRLLSSNRVYSNWDYNTQATVVFRWPTCMCLDCGRSQSSQKSPWTPREEKQNRWKTPCNCNSLRFPCRQTLIFQCLQSVSVRTPSHPSCKKGNRHSHSDSSTSSCRNHEDKAELSDGGPTAHKLHHVLWWPLQPNCLWPFEAPKTIEK